MAGGDAETTRRIVHALQAMSRGDADALEIHGSWADQELAQKIVADFLSGFELDVVFTELAHGFLVSVRNPPTHTIQIELSG
jgi:hypothetical protein